MLYLAGNKTDKVAVGGTESYTALCAKCYRENRHKEIKKAIKEAEDEGLYETNEHLTSFIDLETKENE